MDPILQLHVDLSGAPSRGLANHIYKCLLLAISKSGHKNSTRLPSTRDLAELIGVSRNTVVNVYDRLASEGYVEVKAGSGYYTNTRMSAPTPSTDGVVNLRGERHLNNIWEPLVVWGPSKYKIDFDFTPGIPDTDSFPVDIWRKLCAKANRNQILGKSSYSEIQGREALRNAISYHLKMARSMFCQPDDIIVTSGTQQAIYLLSRILITPGKTTVAFEDPGYKPVREIFKIAGANIVNVPVDREGLIVKSVPANVDIIFVTPSHQYPMGHAMSSRRRLALIELARSTGAVLIEDDYQGEFSINGNPLDSLQSLDRDQSTFYVGTFAKTMFPELRLGFIVAPKWAMQSLLKAKRIVDIESPYLLQDALAQFISDGHLSRHVRRMRKVYAKKRELFVQSMERNCRDWIKSINGDGGLYISAEFTDDISTLELSKMAPEEGIRLFPLQLYAAEPPGINGLVLGFGRLSYDQIEPGVAKLAHMMRGLERVEAESRRGRS